MKRSYPTGLGATFEVIEKLIAGNERAMLAWDKATHAGARAYCCRNSACRPRARPRILVSKLPASIQKQPGRQRYHSRNYVGGPL